MSLRQLAREVGVSHTTIRNIQDGEAEPFETTRVKVIRWTNAQNEQGGVGPAQAEPVESPTPEEALLEYFSRSHQQMSALVSTATEGLGPVERRTVALAILNGFKRLAILSGERIPKELYEIERRFVSE
jgi:DNA-binding XRE family transcriptional regulator